MLGEDAHSSLPYQAFWNGRDPVEVQELRSLRILVCGITGIGKSTLINRIFGVEVVSPDNNFHGLLGLTF